MSDQKSLSKGEREEFLAAVDGVAPLRAKNKNPDTLPHKKSSPSTRPRQREADEAEALIELQDGSADAEIETGEEMLFRREGVQNRVIRKLRRGQYRMDDELDLHGLTVAKARPALAAFLADSLSAGRRCVRIIHGKGIRSGARGPVLRGNVAQWLAQRDEVLAYCSAQPRHGGTGAMYVLLRRG